MNFKKFLPYGVVALFVGVVSILLLRLPSNIPLCSEYFGGEPIPMDCLQPFHGSEMIRLTVDTDGVLKVYNAEGAMIFRTYGEDGVGTYAYAELVTFDEPNTLAPSAIAFDDINYDGYDDIMLLSTRGAYNYIYSYHVYDAESGTFNQTPFLTDIWNPTGDHDLQTIVSYAKGRGIGDMYTQDTFHFENGSYVLIRREVQDLSTTYDTDESYINTIVERKDDGSWATTTKKVWYDEETREYGTK